MENILKYIRLHWYRFIPVMMVMIVIFYLSHQPGDTFNLPKIINIDKLFHCLLYAVLGGTAAVALPWSWWSEKPAFAGALLVGFCLLYGISDEFHQSFIVDRYPSSMDLVADTCGGFLAAIGCWRVRRYIKSPAVTQ